MINIAANNKDKKIHPQNNNNVKLEEQELDTSGFASETTEQEVCFPLIYLNTFIFIYMV